ncbi:hypothetical protein OROMI_017938 [Orobanche minor]
MVSINTNSLRSILDKEKLFGTNYLDWSMNLRIVLKDEKTQYILENSIPDELESTATKAQKDVYNKHVNDSLDVTCLMLATMNSELHIQFEDMEAYEMMGQLKEMFQEQARQERFATMKALNDCKISSVIDTQISAIRCSHRLAKAIFPWTPSHTVPKFRLQFNSFTHSSEKSQESVHTELIEVDKNDV